MNHSPSLPAGALPKPAALLALGLLASLSALSGPARGADSTAAPCATPAQATQVREAYAATPQTPFMAAGKLGLPESVVASALAPDRAVGVAGGEFSKVWASLHEWPDAMTLLPKGGSIFEVRGRVPPGEPSTRSSYFNLDGHDAALGGHLRPDLFGAIYAVEVTGASPPVLGVVFMDQEGEGVFGVYVPAELETPDPATVAAFKRTRDLLRSLPALCR